MKKLQNNFTSQEQSKRLLELGVPRDSADMWYVGSLGAPRKYDPFPSFSYHFDGEIYERDLPCWSLGRLIEIYHICVSPGCSFTFHVCFPNLMNEIMYKLSEANCNGWLDLKKLEE